MEINLPATTVFQKNQQSQKRIIVNQGSTRSSKTYSLAQLFLVKMAQESGIVLTVCRKTLPALKATAYRDFLDILKGTGLYNEKNHNKTELTYNWNNSEIEFISVDQPQKIRGRKRKYLWMNETNEFDYEDFVQLSLRTTGQIYMDYNPSDEFHWIYDKILTRDDCEYIHSTYKDNPFLDIETIKEIERLRETDTNYWRIYGLGERGISNTTIYTHWKLCDELPKDPDSLGYGLDFGFNNPTALVKVAIKDKEIYADEVIYQSHLTNGELIELMKSMDIGKTAPIYADAAEPQRIQEIKMAGFNCLPANKDVVKGIDTIKFHRFFLTKNSINGLKEVKSYRWKEKDGKVIEDEPVKLNDHFLDATRYYVHTNGIRNKADLVEKVETVPILERYEGTIPVYPEEPLINLQDLAKM